MNAKKKIINLLSSLKRPLSNELAHGSKNSYKETPPIRFETLEPRVLLSADINVIPLVTGSIDVPGAESQYAFHIDQKTSIVFDALTRNENIHWSLKGPKGDEVTNTLSTIDPILDLVAGDYTLTLNADNDLTGSYSFRLINLSQTQEVKPNTVITDKLDPASSSHAYHLNALSGEKYYFDQLNQTAFNWRLFDPYGDVVKGFPSTDVDTLTLDYTGKYTLLIEGGNNSTGVLDYSFNIQKVTDDHLPLTVGAITSGAIDHVGQIDIYTFTLTEAKQLYFDSLTNNGSLNWTLTGSRRGIVEDFQFSYSDGEYGANIYDLLAGSYTLTVDGSLDTLSEYSFRLLDISASREITPGQVVFDQLSPANSTNIYKFNAEAGDQYNFIPLSSDGVNYYIHLIDPYGKVVDKGDYLGLITLSLKGTYTLLIEGNISSTIPSNYSFKVDPLGNIPIVPEVGTSLFLDTVINGTLSSETQIDTYTFHLESNTRVYFDSFTVETHKQWSLKGPRGTVIDNQGMNQQDPNYNISILDLLAGDYVLTVYGREESTGNYSFKIKDVAKAVQIRSGKEVSNQLSPANETDLYQFDVTAGDQYYVERRGLNTFSWALLDPYGVFLPNSNVDVDVLTLNYTGKYTLLISDPYYYSQTSGLSYSFNMQKVTDDHLPLTVGAITSGGIDHVGQRDIYTFTLTEAKQLYIDALTNNNLNWRLTGPGISGAITREFLYSENGNPILNLVAGNYTLTIDGDGQTVGEYQFRLLDIAQAKLSTVGSVIEGQLTPESRTKLYQFSATAGDRYYFEQLAEDISKNWILLDPYGQRVFVFNNNVPLKHTGNYTLLVREPSYNNDLTYGLDYSFKIQKVTDDHYPDRSQTTVF